MSRSIHRFCGRSSKVAYTLAVNWLTTSQESRSPSSRIPVVDCSSSRMGHLQVHSIAAAKPTGSSDEIQPHVAL
jgi:hypothetical protein